MCFAIDHNTNALIVLLIGRVVLIRQKHVCPVISLVTDQGSCFLVKLKKSLSGYLHGMFYVKMGFC